MSERTLTETAAAPAALAAFLRGIERRGALFAELQCGDATRGDAALAAVMRAFRESATTTPMATWPHRFWALLLAAPPLRRQQLGASWPPAFAALARLGSGPRAALLLRLVAALPESEAAAVLGIAQPSYRLALQRALPRRADGSPDEIGWRALGTAVQQAITQLPPTRLAHLAQLREAAIQPRRPRGITLRPAVTSPRPRWLLPSLWAGVAACVLAFVASFLLPSLQRDNDEPRIQLTPLPPADAPAATFDAQTALLTDRDFDMFTDGDDAAVPRDLGLQSWYAAQLAATSNAGASAPIAATDPSALDSGQTAVPASTRLEGVDAPP
ncbi:MAG TPA: hypothetical protein VHF02_07825 [Luteimonas sp.]|nr:hypothetical protein [Luteimonas sp.]